MENLRLTDKQIIKSTFVQREISYVWHLWTTVEGIKKFLGIESRIELTPFGAYELYFDATATSGLKGSETCQVLSFIPEEMLSFTWNAPPSYPFVRHHTYKTWVVIQFKKIEDKQTLVELSHLGWPEGQPWHEAFDYFNQAWTHVFQRLEQM